MKPPRIALNAATATAVAMLAMAAVAAGGLWRLSAIQDRLA